MSNQPTDAANKASSNSLNRQIGLYSLAAAAAGVSLLALSEPAAGEVVVTKKTIHIPISTDGIQKRVPISVANNGIDNFSFILSSTAGVRRTFIGFSAGSTGSDNQIIAGGNFYGKALPLSRGTKISSTPTAGVFSWMPLIEATDTFSGSFYSRGYWKGNQRNQYLGVRLQDRRRVSLWMDTANRNIGCQARKADIGSHDHRLCVRDRAQQTDTGWHCRDCRQGDRRTSGSKEHSG